MYQKNLTDQIRIRVSRDDFDFLSNIADILGVSVSHIIRSLIRSARASMSNDDIQSEVVHGDSKTDQQYFL